MKLHLLHQQLGQRQDFILGAENMVNGDATGDLLEVQELHLQRQCSSLKGMRLREERTPTIV